MRYIIFLSLLVVSLTLSAQQYDDIKVYKTFDEFKQVFEHKDDKIHVVNFWATWCGPCVKELPYFEELHQKYKDAGVEVLLVSIDWDKHVEKKVIPFLHKNEYTAPTIVFDDPKTNDWIPKVDPDWSGAIPITIFYKGNQRIFKEQAFHSLGELEEIINTLK